MLARSHWAVEKSQIGNGSLMSNSVITIEAWLFSAAL